jgi:hypothetical protein
LLKSSKKGSSPVVWELALKGINKATQKIKSRFTFITVGILVI